MNLAPRSLCRLFFVLALIVGACAPATRAPTPTTASPPAATDGGEMLNDVHWSRGSAEHRAVLLQIYRAAGARLAELADGQEPGSWAVALDADETVIDNSQYNRELQEQGVSHSAARFAAWAERLEARPLPGVVAFLEKAHALGGRIAIVTNRREAICDLTREDFRRYGIPFDVMLCRGNDREKEGRWQQVREGTTGADLPPLEILMWIGDNIEDFPNLDQELRFAGDEAFAAFGNRYFVIPNPMYGSWLGNPKE